MIDPDAFFRLSGARRREPAIDLWLAAQAPALAALAGRWFDELRDCGDDIRELIHDGRATACVGDAAFAYVAAYSAHVSVGFFHGAALDDPAGLLQGSGKRMRHVKLKPDADHDDAGLRRLIRDACEAVRAGLASRDSPGDSVS